MKFLMNIIFLWTRQDLVDCKLLQELWRSRPQSQAAAEGALCLVLVWDSVAAFFLGGGGRGAVGDLQPCTA